jgi:lambda family phage portal protein
LVRNNAHAGRAISVMVNAIVSTGIRPQPQTGSARIDAMLLDAWNGWGLDADAYGRTDVYGMQRLAVQAWMESGEVLMRRRWRRPDDGLTLPVQIQMLESDYIADSYDSFGRRDVNSERIQMGIELDGIGRRTSYRLYKSHPGETSVGFAPSYETSMVPAREISHVFHVTRPGQLRGVPWLSPIMLDLRDLDDYDHAEMVRAKIASCFVAFRRTNNEDPIGLGDNAEQDDAGDWIETMRPGMVVKLPDGEDVSFGTPPQVGGYADYVNAHLHKIATGAQVPYELLTGDLSQVNYSSIRAGSLEFHRLITALQEQVVEPHVCAPQWQWMVEAAELAGKLPGMTAAERVKALRPEWHRPSWVEIDRESEIKADVMEMQAGVRTLSQAVGKRGGDWRQTLDAIAAEKEHADALGLTLSGFGQVSPSQAVTVPDDADPSGNVDAGAAADVAASADADVQATALNGAQVASLLDIIQSVTAGQLDPASAKAIISASYPLITQAQIDAMVDGAAKFTPRPDDTVEEAPVPEPDDAE